VRADGVGPVLQRLADARADGEVLAAAPRALDAVGEREAEAALGAGGLDPAVDLARVVGPALAAVEVAVPLDPAVRVARRDPALLLPEAQRRADLDAVLVDLAAVAAEVAREVVVGDAGPPGLGVGAVGVAVLAPRDGRSDGPPVGAAEAAALENLARREVGSELRVVVEDELAARVSHLR